MPRFPDALGERRVKLNVLDKLAVRHFEVSGALFSCPRFDHFASFRRIHRKAETGSYLQAQSASSTIFRNLSFPLLLRLCADGLGKRS